MLTARAADGDRIKGLKIGADDYLTKPFNLEELMVRLSRMVERSELIGAPENFAKEPDFVVFGPFKLDRENLTLEQDGQLRELTALEVDLLSEFLKNRGTVLSREKLLHNVWGVRGGIETRTVDNFVVRLRKYIESDPSKPEHLLSVRGRGYKLVGFDSDEQNS